MKRFFLVSLAISFLFVGCAGKKKTTTDQELDVKSGGDVPLVHYRLNSAISPQLKQTPPKRVAVLPPTLSEAALKTSESWDDVNASELFRKVFFGRFSVLPYKDVSLKEVDRILSENGISATSIDQTSAQQLGTLLGADTLIYLHLSEIENVSTGAHGRTEYSAVLKMLDASTGEELWHAELKENIFGGVLSFKTFQLAELFEFEKVNRNRPLAFRKIAEVWSYKVLEDFKEKLGENNE